MPSDFTQEDWELLFEVPSLMGSAVMLAGRSGLGSIKEAMTIASSVVSGGREHPDNPIFAQLDQLRRAGHKSEVEKLGGNYRGMSPEELRRLALDRCRQAGIVVRQKANEHDSQQYLDWLLNVAQRVATAAKEGGFLGIGGERVSQAERDLLAEVEQALQM